MTQRLLEFEPVETRLDKARQIIAMAPEQFRDGFIEWITTNWALYLRFEEESRSVSKLRDHYAAHTIIEYMRHETLMRDNDLDFKINEAWTSSMARLFAHLNPDCRNLFEFRVRKGGVVQEFAPVE